MVSNENYSFTELFDIPRLTQLCESYTRAHGVVTALLDLEGNIHIKTGWQDICQKFHRVNSVSSQRCLESDTALANRLAEGESFNIYRCRNGLVDIAVPVLVDGEHVANFFTGQFLFQEPDRNHFAQQANSLGFELIPYLDALDNVPVFTEEKIRKIVEFLLQLTRFVGEMGKARLEISRFRDQELERAEQLEQQKQELVVARDQLQKLAHQDALTGLHNRRSFTEKLAQEFIRAKRYHQVFCVALADVDQFKDINDNWGHAAGDAALKTIADLISNQVRSSDTVARIGGDEFCILFPQTRPQDIETTLKNLCQTIAATEIQLADAAFHTSCSIGVASFSDDCQDMKDLMIKADNALYAAKQKGKNCVSVSADT